MDKQELKLGACILQNLPDMSPKIMQRWIENPEALKRFLLGLDPRRYLYRTKTVTLAATKGEVTLGQAGDVFLGFVDSYFETRGTIVSGEDTGETVVDVYEMVQREKPEILFRSVGDLRELCLTQGQIKEFCRSHRNLLLKQGHGTCFLFEVRETLFVAGVNVVDGKLRIYANCLDFPSHWDMSKELRLVVKHQTA